MVLRHFASQKSFAKIANTDTTQYTAVHFAFKMTNQNGSSSSSISTDLKLLDLTLKNAGAIQYSCMGDFTAPSAQEIIVCRPGGAIEIYRIETSSSTKEDDDEEEDEDQRTWLKLILRTETMSTLRSMETVRLSGEKRDLVLVGSDSGCVSVLDFQSEKTNILHCPVLGKTGESSFENSNPLPMNRYITLPYLVFFGKVAVEEHLGNI